VGDALGGTNVQNLDAAIRRDGTIVKPDSPLLPIDLMYTSDAANSNQPMVAMTRTVFGSLSVRYVFAYARSSSQDAVTLPLSNLEATGPAFAYDWVTHSGEVIPGGGNLRMKFKDGWDYQMLSPVNRQGLALLGDTRRIVPLGKQRIAALEDRGALTAKIKFATGEDILTISGYAAGRPELKAVQGKLRKTDYDERTKIFEAQVSPDKSGEATLKVRAH